VWQCYIGCWETPSRKEDIDLRILEATRRRDTVSNSCHYASAKEAAAEAALISLNVLAQGASQIFFPSLSHFHYKLSEFT